mmetsp:Transcript_18164/g.25128  ORF Transcript_18164/g.25128 Transcript_18164/m.25128 type:complete len:201 (+) Transcript_18164:1219-1821(+)
MTSHMASPHSQTPRTCIKSCRLTSPLPKRRLEMTWRKTLQTWHCGLLNVQTQNECESSACARPRCNGPSLDRTPLPPSTCPTPPTPTPGAHSICRWQPACWARSYKPCSSTTQPSTPSTPRRTREGPSRWFRWMRLMKFMPQKLCPSWRRSVMWSSEAWATRTHTPPSTRLFGLLASRTSSGCLHSSRMDALSAPPRPTD